MQAFNEYMRLAAPGFAILLNGPWGSGKSHAWNHYVETSLPHLKKSALTFSAAGLNTRDDLDRALFQSSIVSYGSASFREAIGVVGKAALRYVKVDPNDIVLKANLTPDATVVCIDDVERFSGDFETLFGFVVDLTSASVIHCVLIVDENRAAEKFRAPYAQYRERIVGKVVQHKVPTKAFCYEVVKGLGDRRAAEILEPATAAIAEFFETAGVSNLRTVRVALQDLAHVAPVLPRRSSPDLLMRVLQSLAFVATANAKSFDNRSAISIAFSGDAGLAIALHERAIEKRNSEANEPLDRLISVLGETGFRDYVYAFPQSAQLVNLATGKDVDYEALVSEFGSGEDKPEEALDPLVSLRNYRSMADDEVARLIGILLNEAEKQEASSVQRLYSIFYNLYWLSFVGIMELEPAQLALKFLAILKSYDTSRITNPTLEILKAAEFEDEGAVLEEFIALSQRAEAAIGKEARSAGRWKLLNQPEADVSIWGSTPLFEDASPKEFFSQLLIARVDAITRVAKVFQHRAQIMNSPSFVGSDRDFAYELAAEIESRVRFERPMSVHAAEMMELKRGLAAFVAHVDKFNQNNGHVSAF